jgi:hypothetical protein
MDEQYDKISINEEGVVSYQDNIAIDTYYFDILFDAGDKIIKKKDCSLEIQKGYLNVKLFDDLAGNNHTLNKLYGVEDSANLVNNAISDVQTTSTWSIEEPIVGIDIDEESGILS